MATVCFDDCYFSTDDDGRLTLKVALIERCAIIGDSTGVADITGDQCDLITFEQLTYTNGKDCDQRVTLMYDVHVDMDQIRPCGNPLVELQESDDGGMTWVTVQSEAPRKYAGWSQAGGVDMQSSPFNRNFTLEPGESFTRDYRVCFRNFLLDCTECDDCDPDTPEPEDLNTQPRLIGAAWQVTALCFT